MSIASIFLLCGLIFLMLAGLPIAFSLGIPAILTILISKKVPFLIIPQKFFSATDSFPLLAIIFFLIAGELMLQGGISKRLVNFATSILYWMRGSLSYIAFLSCAFFGAISGSSMATTAAIGGVMYPEMIKDGAYDKHFAGTVQAVGGTLGTMIPPSLPLIIYGTICNTSIRDLFLAVVIPGIIMMVIFMLTSALVINKRGYAREKESTKKINIREAFLDAFWALLAPVIILGGIYGGIFTPTESAAIACGYALIVGMFVYKELTFKNIYNALLSASITSASIMLLYACAYFFGFMLTIEGVIRLVTEYLIVFASSKFFFLLLANLILLITGMFIDATTAQVLIMPLLFPIANYFGINPVHFGIIVCINLSIGMATPPFGACLFVAAGLDRSLKIELIYRNVIIFAVTGILGILLITFIEPLALVFIK